MLIIICFCKCSNLFIFEGAMDGVVHLFTPKWESILEPVVWLEAGTQIFFSLGLAFGGLIAFRYSFYLTHKYFNWMPNLFYILCSSYNPANNNCYKDAILVSLTNCGTSMFAGVVVFSVIGFKVNDIET